MTTTEIIARLRHDQFLESEDLDGYRRGFNDGIRHAIRLHEDDVLERFAKKLGMTAAEIEAVMQ